MSKVQVVRPDICGHHCACQHGTLAPVAAHTHSAHHRCVSLVLQKVLQGGWAGSFKQLAGHRPSWLSVHLCLQQETWLLRAPEYTRILARAAEVQTWQGGGLARRLRCLRPTERCLLGTGPGLVLPLGFDSSKRARQQGAGGLLPPSTRQVGLGTGSTSADVRAVMASATCGTGCSAQLPGARHGLAQPGHCRAGATESARSCQFGLVVDVIPLTATTLCSIQPAWRLETLQARMQATCLVNKPAA